MLTKPTVSELRALVLITRSGMWPEFNGLLSRELSKAMEMLVDSSDDRALRAIQGRAQMLRDLLALMNDAPERLEKLETRRP